MTFLLARLRTVGRLLAFTWVALTSAARGLICPGDLAARAQWLQGTCARALRALGVKLNVVGAPSAGAIIVANHVSYLDILVLAAMRPVVFVAKREVRDWPVFGWFARRAGTRFIDRNRRSDVARVVGEFAPAAASGVSIVIFLEGTSTDGRAVQPFKSSLLEPALQRRWSVVPAAISYALPAGHDVTKEVCWWGDMALAPHLLHCFALPRIQAFVAWGAAEAAAGDRKVFAARLHARVTRLHLALAGAAG